MPDRCGISGLVFENVNKAISFFEIKRPIGVTILSIFGILYGLLDIGQLFMPEVNDKSVIYSVHGSGIVLLVSGIGSLVLKKWVRFGMILGCILAIFPSIMAMIDNESILGNTISVIIFGSVCYYFTRSSVELSFLETD